MNGPYFADACGPLVDVVLLATTDGVTPAAGAQIVVTLPAGLTWSDGTAAPRALVTDGNGNVTLSGLLVTSAAGTHSITATSGTVSTAGVVEIAASGVAHAYANTTTGTSDVVLSNVPAGSTAVGAAWFLAPDGTLWHGNTQIAANVTSARVEIDGNDNNYVGYVTSDGVARVHAVTGAGTSTAAHASVPLNSTPLGASWFLAPDDTLWHGNTQIAANVANASDLTLDAAQNNFVGYVSNDGTAHQYAVTGSGGSDAAFTSVPDGATALGAAWFLAPDGTLWHGNTQIAANVTSARAEIDGNDFNFVGYVTSDGVAHEHSVTGAGSSTATNASIPLNSTPLGGAWFLAPDRTLWMHNTQIAVNVANASVLALDASQNNFIGYVATAC